METIKINNSVFLIPPSQPKLQANCAKEYGQFLLDYPPKLTILEAQAGGYLMQGQIKQQCHKVKSGKHYFC